MKLPSIYITGIFIISLGAAISFYFFIPLFEVTGFMKALDGILLFSSISLGFYGACLSVLASIFNTPIVKDIMKDKEYRKEFIELACASLISGFLTVVTTIIYQVLLENEYSFMRGINAVWFFFVLTFLLCQLIFFVVLFLIFFRNPEEESLQDEQVHKPNLNQDI